MNQPLYPAFLCAIAAAIVLGIAKDMNEGTTKNIFVFAGVVFLVFGAAWGMLAVLDRLAGPMFAFGDLAEKLIHPEIALVTAMGNLDKDQLSAYLQEASKIIYFVGKDGKADFEIKSKGRYLSSQFVSNYLYKCESFYPDLPAVSANAPKSGIYANEEALISFFREMGYCTFRIGQNDLWVNDRTPETVRKVYFDNE